MRSLFALLFVSTLAVAADRPAVDHAAYTAALKDFRKGAAKSIDALKKSDASVSVRLAAVDDVRERLVDEPNSPLTDEVAERAGKAPKSIWKHVFRPRTILYTVLWAGVGIALIVALFIRSDIDVNVTPVRNPTFVTLSDGSIRNTYDIRLRNKFHEARDFAFTLETGSPLQIEVEGSENQRVNVPADATHLQRIYVIAPPGSPAATSDRTDVVFWIEDLASSDRISADTIFNGKGK